jgi:HEAT repeat protein
MSKTIMTFACLSALLSAFPITAWGGEARALNSEQEAKLIAVLTSSATPLEKGEACRELARIGTRAAVKPLSGLLGDEKLSHMARYGLEPIPDPAVDESLRDAAAKLSGRTLVGVIGSIGVRRDAKAVELLTKRLTDRDTDVMEAAARALGSIGTPEAIKALENALPGVLESRRPVIAEGLFRCAEAMFAHGQRDDARAIYERVSRAVVPQHVRDGAAKRLQALRQEEGPRL